MPTRADRVSSLALARGLTAATVAVIGWSTARALAGGYLPLDDNAATQVRAGDVFSMHPPLTGLVSSASQDGGVVAHLGPLQLYLLAVPVRLLPDGAGLAVGTALINAAAIVAVAWCARRLAGADQPMATAIVWAAGAAALVWAFGSEALYEPWQPIATVIPFLLVLVAWWAFAAGRDTTLPIAVLAATYVVQTHASYLLLVPAVVVAAIVVRLTAARRVPVRRRPVLVAAAVALAVWVAPLVDQFAGGGNLGRVIARGDGGGELPSVGFARGLRAAAMVLVEPPWWTRSAVDHTLPAGGFAGTADAAVFDPDWLALPIALGGMCALLAAVVVLGWLAARRGDAVIVAGAAILFAGVTAAVVSVGSLPVDAFGFSAHRVRWLWVLGVFATGLALTALVRLGRRRLDRDGPWTLAVVAAALLAATVPTHDALLSPQRFVADHYDTARNLRRAAAALDHVGVVYLNTSGRPLPDPYNDVFAAALLERGTEVRVAGDYAAGQYGGHRRLTGPGGADVTVRLFVGGAIAEGYRPVVHVEGNDGTTVVVALADGVVLGG